MSLRLIAALLLAAVAAAQGLPAMTVKELMARLGSIRQATDFRASGRLVRVEVSGERRNYRLSLRARWVDGAVKMFCEVTDPPPARVRLLLETPDSRPASIRKGHGGDPRPVALPPENWGESVLGTGFSYEDLLENHFLWRRQTLEGETRYGARRCYRLKSVPEPDDRSQYAAVTSWLDRESLYPVRVEKTLRSSGAVREFIYYGLRESKGIWSASQIEVKTPGTPGSSLLIITRGSEKARVGVSELDPALLTRR